MREIEINSNDAGRRLDRWLRKYLPAASLGTIYKIIRKDVKVDGRRQNENYMLSEGETVTLYISDEQINAFRKGTDEKSRPRAKRNFGIVYEDDNILVVDKPFGLLTHGDSTEKKNHLANQVRDYLIEIGEFNPRNENVFSPAPANRLDRNTTGLVLCGKTALGLKGLNEIIRQDKLSKYYLTICEGRIEDELRLSGSLVKDERTNKVRIVDSDEGTGIDSAREIVTIVRPLELLYDGRHYATLAEVELVTGRSHQIRAHLAHIGHPLLGDVKYGGHKEHGLSTQLLHAARIEISDSSELPSGLEYLRGMKFEAARPESFGKILRGFERR